MNKNCANIRQRRPLFLTASVFVLVVLFAPYSLLDDLSLTSIISLAISGASAAWLFANAKWLIGAFTSIPVLLISIFCLEGSLLFVLGSLLYLVLGITFAMVYHNMLTRATAVGISGILLTTAILAMLLSPIIVEQGTLSATAIRAYYADFFGLLTETLKKSFTIVIAGTEVSYVSDANVHQYLNFLIALMPGIIGFFSVLIGFLCGGIFKILIRLSHLDPPSEDGWKLTPTFITGIFFSIALLFCLVGSDSNYPFLVAITFVLFLAPEFCMAGLSSVFEVRYINDLPHPRIFRAILLFIGMLNGIEGFLLVTALFGIVDSFRTVLPAKKSTE